MTNDTFHEHDTRQRKQFRPPLARSNQRSRAMRYTGVKVNNYFMNHMGYNGSFAMFKKEVKKFIIENDVSLSCLWCLIDIIHWMYHCNLVYSETIVRKCSPETSGCVIVPSRYWFKYWLGAWPASNQCMGQRLLMWQSSRPASFSPAGLTLWPSSLERWLATLSGLLVQVRIPVGLPVPGHYTY